MDNKQITKNINKGRPVYFSYARNSTRKPEWNHISDCVEQILKIFREQEIEYRLDIRDIGAGDNISDFEKEIGWNSEVVVLVLSDKYLQSLHCMYEYVQIQNAIKKYPQKQCICIKSGNLDLDDNKYLEEIVHYWGDMKQEYETIEYHHLRNHSGTEIAAKQNGFYINEILSLNDFVKKHKCYNADSVDWNEITNHLVNYFLTTKKSFLQHIQERKAKLTKIFAFTIGFASILSIIALLILGMMKYQGNIIGTVYQPAYVENGYTFEDEIYTTITKYIIDDKYTTLYFHSVNLTDDTLRKVEYDTAGAYLEIGEYIKDIFLLREIGGLDNKQLPEYYPGGKGAAVDYYMKFDKTPGEEFYFFNDNAKHNIYGIKYMANYEITNSILSDNTLCLTIEHPECSSGLKNLFVTRVEIAPELSSLQFHYINASENDTTLFDPSDCRMVIKNDTVKIRYVNGIKTYPFSTTVFKKTDIYFALYFRSFKDTINSIDFIINDSTKISGIKLHREHIHTVNNPAVTGYHLGGANVTKVEINNNETVLHFTYANNFKKNTFFTRANTNSYIVANGVKYPLQKVCGINQAPDFTIIPPLTTLEYALIFPPIPPETSTIDFVNNEYSREKIGDQRFRTLVYILGSECANETGDTISTGSFGIRLK